MSIIRYGLNIFALVSSVQFQFLFSVILSKRHARGNPNFCFFLIITSQCIRHRAVIFSHLLPWRDISAVQSFHCWIPTWSCTPRPDFGRRWRPSASFLSVFNKTGDCPSSLRACRVHVSPYKTPSPPSPPITDPLRDTNLPLPHMQPVELTHHLTMCNLWTTLRLPFKRRRLSYRNST